MLADSSLQTARFINDVLNPLENELQKLRIDKDHKARRDERQSWPWIALMLLLVVSGIGFWQWQSASAAAVVETIRVRIPEGTQTNAEAVKLNATGYIIAAHKIELATKVVGRVAWVGVEMGDKIDKDQILVRLEDDEYKARVTQQQGLLDNAKARLAELEAGSRKEEIAQAKATLDQSKAELANAEMNFNRLSEMAADRTVSQKEVDDADTLIHTRRAQVDFQTQQYELSKLGPRKEQIDAQRATVRQLEGGLALAMVDLDNTVVKSTISGTVLERNVEVGEFVTTGFVGDRGAKGYVVSIADLNDLRVELDVSQNDFAKVSPRQPCWIVTDAYPDRKYNGVVDLISPEANRQKATVQVRVKVINPDELLKPDMNATVSFLARNSDASTTQAAPTSQVVADRPAFRIPSGAVREGAVFVLENAKAVKRTVTVGQTSGGEVEIKKGLIGGEDLIVNPPANLHDGDLVKPRDGKN